MTRSKQVEEDQDFKPELPEPARKKRKGGRGSVACLLCRASKTSCDLKAPCGSCIAKGEEHSCSLTNLLWYENPEDAPASKLKASVDRLESLVLAIRAGSSQGGSPRPTASPRTSFHGSSGPSSSTSKSSSPIINRRSANPTCDAEVIGRLILGRDVGGHVSPGVDLRALVNELQFAEPSTASQPLPQLAEPTSLQTRPSPEAFASLLQIMPTRRQASEAIAAFFGRVDSLFHVVHRQRFEAQCVAYWESQTAPDPHWLATFLCVAGNGLLAMSDNEALSSRMPTGEGKSLLARSWLDGALQALASGGEQDFVKSPSVEAVRAVVLLNQFWAAWQGGTNLQAAIVFNTTVISAAFELDLHRDPDELDRGFSPLESEERRRVFWGLFSSDTLARSFLGKSYAPLDCTSISTRLPSHLPDEAFTSTGDFEFAFSPQAGTSTLTSVVALHSISLVLCKMSKLFASTRRPSSAEISRLHEDLQLVEVAHSPTIQRASPVLFNETLEMAGNKTAVQAMLAFAYVRLHRSCLVNGLAEDSTTDAVWHRAICLQHSNSLIASVAAIESCGAAEKLLASVAIVSAAITLAVDLLDSPHSPQTNDTRARLANLITAFESDPWSSRVFRRGATILRHLTLDSQERQPLGLTGPAPSFFGMGHSRSASSGSGGSPSMVDTPPSFLVANQAAVMRRTSDQASLDYYLSPYASGDPQNPFADSFDEAFFPLSIDPRAQQYSPDQYNFKLGSEAILPSPLLRPWLASTQAAGEFDWTSAPLSLFSS